MDKLVLFTETDLKSLLKKRSGESKFGEHIKLLSNVTDIYEQLKNLDVDYVIFGIPEDAGVFANHRNTGTSRTWYAVLKILLNIQSNRFTRANKILLLGHLDCDFHQKRIQNLKPSNKNDINKARKIVSKIDKQVTELVFKIVESGKTPIIIGGGHNNAYGNIKGTSLALNKLINAINFDSFANFKTEEGRHNNNGFTYAKSDGFLNNYFIFGLHENYIPENVLKIIAANSTISFHSFESIMVRKEQKFKTAIKHAAAFVNKQPFGIEIDCNAIKEIPNTMQFANGFSISRARTFINFFGKQPNATYLHICEALANTESEAKVGNQITQLITDFIKAHGD